jgi:hypothetical protein
MGESAVIGSTQLATHIRISAERRSGKSGHQRSNDLAKGTAAPSRRGVPLEHLRDAVIWEAGAVRPRPGGLICWPNAQA